MKKYLLIIVLIIGCSENVPDNLIDKEKMENIIFDIMILNASSGFDLKVDKNLLSDEFIYKKYNIDSLQFFESELYYSKNPRDHYEIYAKVKIRILKSIDSLRSIDSLQYIN
jgi:hypothetical protein|tara:strand:+ start:702 stop:1037 length:336 start_codon:yes stop_codon:yes gene_type:complete